MDLLLAAITALRSRISGSYGEPLLNAGVVIDDLSIHIGGDRLFIDKLEPGELFDKICLIVR